MRSIATTEATTITITTAYPMYMNFIVGRMIISAIRTSGDQSAPLYPDADLAARPRGSRNPNSVWGQAQTRLSFWRRGKVPRRWKSRRAGPGAPFLTRGAVASAPLTAQLRWQARFLLSFHLFSVLQRRLPRTETG